MKKKVIFGIGTMGIGGAERVTLELLKRFDRERFECQLVTLLDNPEKNFLDEVPRDVEVHKFAFASLHDLRSLWHLYRKLAELKSDVVVSHMFFSNTVFRLLKPFVGYAAIPCEHNTEVYKTGKHKTLDRLLAYISYRIVAVSSTVAAYTAKQEGIPKEKFVVIHNGIDVEKMQSLLEALPSKNVLKQELGFEESDRIFLNVARLTGQKNHKLLLDGFALFHKNHPDCKLAIVGQGDLRPKLEVQARELGVEGAVVFFGMRRDVEKFYKVCNIFVSASDFEGLSISYLEAFASGVPIVSTETAGTDELVEDGKNGFLIHESTIGAVAKIFEKTMAADLAQMGESAKERATMFDIGICVERYEKLCLESIL